MEEHPNLLGTKSTKGSISKFQGNNEGNFTPIRVLKQVIQFTKLQLQARIQFLLQKIQSH